MSFFFSMHSDIDALKVKVPNDLQLSLSLSLHFSSFCCLLKIEPPNHQRSAAAGPVGAGFGKRVPEMSLINSLRRREQGRGRWRRWGLGGGGWRGKERVRDRGREWVNNDREMERVKRWSGAKRGG